MASSNALFVVLGNHLFGWSFLKEHADAHFFMAEDVGLCTFVRHHKQKIGLFLAAMRGHADMLRERGCSVHYQTLDDPGAEDDYTDKLAAYLDRNSDIDELITFEIEDRWFETKLDDFASRRGLQRTVLQSPMFLNSRQEFADYLDDNDGKLFMANFYAASRRRLDLMMNGDGSPQGGRFSFDDENRKKLPKKVDVPRTSWSKPTPHVEALRPLIEERFAEHPGSMKGFAWPTTRRQALAWLREFLEQRFHDFGPYEDALSDRDPVLFHSALSPVLNLGLLTPAELIERAVTYAGEHGVPMNSLEGFVRQVIGWREFVRGVDRHHGAAQSESNYWGHHRLLKPCWYDGTTGMRPLDDAIRKAERFGWNHHIERLMVLANLFNLCEVQPRAAYRWFMEMYVDSSDWVMGPNVYGMGLMSDGGLFATKPYICGSNYIVKMSDCYTKSQEWCEVLDGLYWRFVDQHRDFFSKNARLSMMLGTLGRMADERRERIFTKADRFIDDVTLPG
ncbi:MAG: cryptochrome/photolyase family protein [Myxococcota bacterium]